MSVTVPDQDNRRDYTSLIQSYGYGEDIANAANAILYSSMRNGNNATKKVMEAVWMAHNKEGKACDIHLIGSRIKRRLEGESRVARVKILPEGGVVRMRSCLPYVDLYLEEAVLSFIGDEEKHAMRSLAARIDETDGLPVITTNAAVAVIRWVLDEKKIEYKKDVVYKELGKNATSINGAMSYLSNWLIENP